MKKITLVLLAVSAILVSCCNGDKNETGKLWSKEKANEWYAAEGWRSGCNYIPCNAINQIEMWQSLTFDSKTIDKELAWAEELGFRTMRVFLSSVVWKNEAESFKGRIGTFLEIADRHGIKPVFVFFDDCWNPESAIGPQRAPQPGIHNSGWVQDPSVSLRKDTIVLYPVLEAYVKDIMTTFKDDSRILWWDLYNEPGNSGHSTSSLPLLKKVFKWARDVNPSQPISAGLWNYGLIEMNSFIIENSDIISYHAYSSPQDQRARIDILRSIGRPVFCTEYMARKNESTFQNTLPLLKEMNVGAINWGFVSGKTNTIYAWGTPIPDGSEPELWFHDIYRQDKTPFDQAEIDIIKKTNGK